MTCLTKLFLNYMQVHGFTCGLDDLILKKKINKTRKTLLESAHEDTVREVCKAYGSNVPSKVFYMGRSEFKCDDKGNAIE